MDREDFRVLCFQDTIGTPWPQVVDAAAQAYRPHYLATFAYQLATAFNEFYQEIPVLGSKEERSRVALVKGVQLVLKEALELLGIEAPERM